jgi:hypothetical protein
MYSELYFLKRTSPHSWTILEGENPRILQKIRSPVFQCSRVHDVGRTLVVFPNKSEAFKLTMNAGYYMVFRAKPSDFLRSVNNSDTLYSKLNCTVLRYTTSCIELYSIQQLIIKMLAENRYD